MDSLQHGGLFATESFVPVDLRSLGDCDVAMCDLYRFTSQHGYVLFLSKHAEFADHLRDQLIMAKARRLYIRAEEASEYSHYMTDRVRRFADAPDADSKERAEVAYQAVHFLVDRLLDAPTPESYEQLVEGVTATVYMALQDPTVAYALLAHTRQGSYMYSHTVNVGVYGTALALQLNQDDDWLNSVAVGLFAHDIGKTKIPAEVLAWPGPFSAAHWALMKQHPGLGLVILNALGQHDPIVRSIVVQHHERNDGSGYPKGLMGPKISYEAKICAMADTFDALTSKRSYRDTATTFEALDTMIKEMGDEFDREMLASFVKLFRRESRQE